MEFERKITLGEPVIIAQNTTEPILFGGWQLPDMRINKNKEIDKKINKNWLLNIKSVVKKAKKVNAS